MPATNDTVLIDQQLLRASVRMNTLLFTLLGALIGGVTLFLLTRLTPPEPESLLNILFIFLPGYSLSGEGAWLGLWWGAVIGGSSAALFYLVYARGIEGRVLELLDSDLPAEPLTRVAITLNPLALGITAGLFAAFITFVGSSFLARRGHLPGIHVELLQHWLPGFELSPSGALYGAIGMFVVVFASLFLLASLYNRLIASRGGVGR